LYAVVFGGIPRFYGICSKNRSKIRCTAIFPFLAVLGRF
jgi:hypothetical protein